MYRRFVFVSGKSVELIDEYKIPFFAATVFKHTLKVRSVVVRARHGSVDIGIENKYIILLCVFLANAQLSFDRLLRLVIAGIPCIDNCHISLWTVFIIKQKPPAMPVDKRKTTQALAAERSRYTKKLLCAKLNVRLATVHK